MLKKKWNKPQISFNICLRINKKEEKGGFHIHIIAQPMRIGNEKVINLTEYIKKILKKGSYIIRNHEYKITFNGADYVIICPEIWKKSAPGEEHIIIVPDYLIPGRPYPIYIYLYAMELYSNNKHMGQRAAAEATRVYFGLKTFAHTTLGRAMKSLWSMITETEDKKEPEQITDTGKETIAANDAEPVKRFPTVQDTHEIRKQIKKFIGRKLNKKEREAFIEACHNKVKETVKKTGRLILMNKAKWRGKVSQKLDLVLCLQNVDLHQSLALSFP